MAKLRPTLAFLCSTLFSISVFATNPRVFVASTGTDTGACTRGAPCRNFAFAMTQVSPGGELVALDTAGYGPVTVPFAVSIYSAPGAVASVTAMSGNDITIMAGANDAVMIRGLFLNSNGSQKGISFDSGGVLTVQDTTFMNFSAFPGLNVERGPLAAVDSPRVFITNCRFFNSYEGIYAWSGNNTTIYLSVRNSHFENIAVPAPALEAIFVGDFVHAAITDSTFISNKQALVVYPTSGLALASADAAVERCTFLNNETALSAFGSGNAASRIRVAYSMIVNNVTGVAASGGGQVLSRFDGTSPTNTLELNSNGNTFSGSYAAK